MEITLNTKRIDYQTAVEILNSTAEPAEKYNICGPNLISKGNTLYTYAGIRVNKTLYSEYEITPENYNDFYKNVEKTKPDGKNIKFYLIPQIKQNVDKSYTLTANEEIKDSITLCYEYNTYNTTNKTITPCTCEKQFTDKNTIDLTTIADLQDNYKYDIYYNIKTCSCTTTKEEEITIQSQHQIYDNITPAYFNLQTNFAKLESGCRKLSNAHDKLQVNYNLLETDYQNLFCHYVSEFINSGSDEDASVYIEESKNCWVKTCEISEDSLEKTYTTSSYVSDNYTLNSDITCVIDYKKFISESSTNSHLGCVHLEAIAPNIFCNTSDNCIFSYLGQADVNSNTDTTIYNHRSVSCSQYSAIISDSDKPFLILKPLEFCTGSDWIYICPIKIYCFKYDSVKKTTLCDYTCKLQNLNIKIRGPKQFDSNNICYCETEKYYSYKGSEGNGIFPIRISDYYSPTDTKPWEFYYTIQTKCGPVESPHSLVYYYSDESFDTYFCTETIY